MLNKIFLQGRMCSDPELRHTQTGTSVTNFTLAVDRDFKDKGGNRETDFIDCTIWKGGAEFVSRYFTKGSMAVVVGSLQLRDWTDKEGNKRRTAQVVAENIYFGDSKREEPKNDYTRQVWPDKPESGNNAAGYVVPGGTSDVDSGEMDGELPF